jgi:hypothetical protein
LKCLLKKEKNEQVVSLQSFRSMSKLWLTKQN